MFKTPCFREVCELVLIERWPIVGDQSVGNAMSRKVSFEFVYDLVCCLELNSVNLKKLGIVVN